MSKPEIAVSESVAAGVNAIYQAGFAAGEKHAQAWPRRVGAAIGGAVGTLAGALIIAALLGAAFVGGAIFQEHQAALSAMRGEP